MDTFQIIGNFVNWKIHRTGFPTGTAFGTSLHLALGELNTISAPHRHSKYLVKFRHGTKNCICIFVWRHGCNPFLRSSENK